jgi:predicted nucleic acid-binding protein
MIGVDSNILVQLANADHPKHASTVTTLAAERLNGNFVLLTPIAIAEFLHVVTDQRRFPRPSSMPEALEWVRIFLDKPGVLLIMPTEESLQLSLGWMAKYALGRKRILDTQLAAMLHWAGCRRLMTENPSDFAVFGIFELITPI